MRCPHCEGLEDKVLESRSLADGSSIRRRRECLKCGYRFTSYERIEEKLMMVVKSSGRREPFDRKKLERGIQRACEKRNISQVTIEELVNDLEDEAAMIAKSTHEISSKEIGDMVLQKLLELDSVAYIRFASVYRNFKTVEEFVGEIARFTRKGRRAKTRA